MQPSPTAATTGRQLRLTDQQTATTLEHYTVNVTRTHLRANGQPRRQRLSVAPLSPTSLAPHLHVTITQKPALLPLLSIAGDPQRASSAWWPNGKGAAVDSFVAKPVLFLQVCDAAQAFRTRKPLFLGCTQCGTRVSAT